MQEIDPNRIVSGLPVIRPECTNCCVGSIESRWEAGLGWAVHYIEKLQAGETVSFRPRGASMKGKIESGQLCTVAPVDCSKLSVGDIVLCKVRGNEYLHIIKAINGPRFQIGNNRGLVNGWIGSNGIFGKCIRIEP